MLTMKEIMKRAMTYALIAKLHSSRIKEKTHYKERERDMDVAIINNKCTLTMSFTSDEINM